MANGYLANYKEKKRKKIATLLARQTRGSRAIHPTIKAQLESNIHFKGFALDILKNIIRKVTLEKDQRLLLEIAKGAAEIYSEQTLKRKNFFSNL